MISIWSIENNCRTEREKKIFWSKLKIFRFRGLGLAERCLNIWWQQIFFLNEEFFLPVLFIFVIKNFSVFILSFLSSFSLSIFTRSVLKGGPGEPLTRLSDPSCSDQSLDLTWAGSRSGMNNVNMDQERN